MLAERFRGVTGEYASFPSTAFAFKLSPPVPLLPLETAKNHFKGLVLPTLPLSCHPSSVSAGLAAELDPTALSTMLLESVSSPNGSLKRPKRLSSVKGVPSRQVRKFLESKYR